KDKDRNLSKLSIVYTCIWVRNLRLKRRLPGPFAWPVVGNAMQLGQMPHITFAKLAKKYGNVYQIRLGCSDIVVLNGDKAIRQALIQHSTEFAGRPNFVSFQMISGGRSMTFTNYSKQWKAHRKIAQSSLRAFPLQTVRPKKPLSNMLQLRPWTTVTDLIGAGQDTVSTLMQWMLLLLVKYPDVQAKLHNLIDKVVGPDRLPSTEDRRSLAYLDAFIYETMRFTSFVPVTILTPRPQMSLLKSPHPQRHLEDPHIFDPTRFLDENGDLDKDITNNVMIFSTGKRRCIGNQIAKVEAFLFIAILLHQCSFENNPSEHISLDCSYGLTLKPLRFCVTAKLRGKLLGVVSPA
uniref:Cytochrome P450, family 1, subfamily C, polypeptide 1 n=1 Tax=Sphaeramia orbicularis TaxID=375764 RepID=A0A673CBV0_9TELE